MKRRPASCRQKGSALVECALAFPVILGVALISADLFMTARARADLERSASTFSAILASQTSLTSDGLDRLVEGIMGGRSDRYELFVGQVMRSGEVAWRITLGDAQGLCDNPLEADYYQDPLPELDPDDETGAVAMLVVQACQDSRALGLSTLTLEKTTLKTLSIDRMRTADPEMDEALRRRAGLPEEEDEPQS